MALGITPEIVRLKSLSKYFTSELYTVVFYGENKEILAKLPITFDLDGWYIGGNLVCLNAMPIAYLAADLLIGAMWNQIKK